MRLSFSIDGREALPVRAVPWVVGAEMFTRRVLLPPYLIVSSARTACDAKDIIPSSPLLRLYRYDKDGRVLPVTSERLDAIAPDHDFQSESDEPLHEVTCRLPAGVFVFLDELRRFVDWIYPPGCHDGECRDAITLNTSPDLPDEMIERLREGFVAPRPNAASERSRPRTILFWLAPNEILIPADQVPGAIADTLYPPLERNESVGSALNDSNTVRRLEAEREQAKQLRRKFPHLKEGDKFSIGELNAYLASMGIAAEIRHRNDTSQIVSLGPEGRWAGRQFAHGFNSVRDPVITAKRSPAVSDSRCCIIASEQELHIDHWIELTGVGVGQHESYFVANDRVTFLKWEDDLIAESPADWQIEMHRDNRIAPSLVFPCSPQELLTFVDTAIGIHCFMVPEAFRAEVERLETSETGRAESDKPAGDWKNQRIGWRKSVVAIWPELLNLYRRKPTVEKLVEELEKNDPEGYVVPSGVPDELKWRQVKNKGGEPKTVSRDTIEDFISSLPGYRA